MRRDKKEQRKLEARIKWLAKNKINYLQPTISPAPKNVERGEIESLKEAMDYYAPYSEHVVLQKKHMGSYCMMYLNKEHEKSYFVSRNGYVIKHVEGLHKASEEIHKTVFAHYIDAEWVLLESELMPWRTLGDSLIDREYGNYGILHKSHLNTLKNTNIVAKIETIRKDVPWEKEDLKSHEKRQYTSLRDIAIPNIEEYNNSIKVFDRQLEIFGASGEIKFEVFNTVKVITDSGKEHLIYTNANHGIINTPSIRNSEIFHCKDYESAYEFFDKYKQEEAEGIMVKPLKQRLVGIAPALKVRTNAYLQLIYGVNFDRDFDYYMEKRNIKRKLQLSIQDYEISSQLLNIKREHISEKNIEYMNLVTKFIDGEEYGKTLDTRL